MEPLLSPRELALALGVSESSIKRWVDGGDLAALKTAGGHRRIARSEAIRFVRRAGIAPARPELLNLVGLRIQDSALGEAERDRAFHQALLDDDRSRAIGLLTSAFVAGASIASLGDGPIRFALEAIGELWKHDGRGILVEHRATDVCVHALGVLRSALPPPLASAPVAVGSAGPEDPYLLPSTMCALALAEIGFRDVDLGAFTPVATKISAAEAYGAVLVWHSASVGGEEIAALASGLASSRAAAARIVAGGRRLSGPALPASVVPLAGMRELQAFARGLGVLFPSSKA